MRKILIFFILLQGYFLNAQNLKSVTLNGTWTLYYSVQNKNTPATPDELKNNLWTKIPATVPGNVELDLFAAGTIKNPEIGNNIYNLRKYEGYQWCYHKKFSISKINSEQRLQLFFGGIDCLSDIYLNGQKIGQTDNMLIEHSFDITDKVNYDGENELHVFLRSPVIEAQKYILGQFSFRFADVASVRIRKAPHMYGWDIMPRLVSAGLWRNVELQIIDPVNFVDVNWLTTNADPIKQTADLSLTYQLNLPFRYIDNLESEVTIKKDNKVIFKKTNGVDNYATYQRITLDQVDFWWPRGYGKPNLYDVEINIKDKKGKVLATNSQRIGIRTVKLDRTDISTAENPGKFCFVVNGVKIFVRGTNWVPLDALHSRDTQHVKQSIDMLVDLNCNMVRCWGGNVYEDHQFFNLCDESGIMVWQDFAMGCSFYSQEQDFVTQIEKEVKSVVLKLRNHPSLVLWAGNNENDQIIHSPLRLNPNNDVISRSIIPKVLYEFDSTRPYLASSPYVSPLVSEKGLDYERFLPEVHLWGPRGYYKAPFYTSTSANFVSEIGYHGCPNRESLEKMFDKQFVYPWGKDFEWNDQWVTKSVRILPESDKTRNRNDLMLNQIKALFGIVPLDLDSFIQASQIVQAEAKKYFIEFWRAGKFDRTGIIWWNLRDGWPIISDAVVDYYNSKKLAYYYIQQVQKDVCVLISDAKNGKHSVIAVNDTQEEKSGKVIVKDADTGEILFSAPFNIPVNGKTVIGNIPEIKVQTMWLIEYTVGDEKQTNHYLSGTAPFKLVDYLRWYQKLNIKRD